MNYDAYITIDGVSYPVVIIKKRQKNAYFRLKDGYFQITAPYFRSNKSLIEYLNKIARNLIKLTEKHSKPKEVAEDSNSIYIFGQKYDKADINLTDEDLEKYLNKLLKDYIIARTREAEKEMGVTPPYRIAFRKMKSRYGSNSSRTHTIHYDLNLVHYSKDIIDSIIYHELTHHFVRDHSKKFYNKLYEYCPNYDKLRKAIIHKQYAG